MDILEFLGLRPRKLVSPAGDPELLQARAEAQGILSPLAKILATPAPMPAPAPAPDYLGTMEKTFEEYGASPEQKALEIMAGAPERYDIFKKYPYLLPALAVTETSAGKNINVNYPYNILNWGIYPQKKGLFNPQSQAEVVEKALTGIGERMGAYEPFRRTGELEGFANIYAPPTENIDYFRKLKMAMELFK